MSPRLSLFALALCAFSTSCGGSAARTSATSDAAPASAAGALFDGARLVADVRAIGAAFAACDEARLAEVAVFPFHERCSGYCGEKGGEPIDEADEIVPTPAALARWCARPPSLGRPEDVEALLHEADPERALARLETRKDGRVELVIHPGDGEGMAWILHRREGRWRIGGVHGWGD
jgi:hypothetical protein